MGKNLIRILCLLNPDRRLYRIDPPRLMQRYTRLDSSRSRSKRDMRCRWTTTIGRSLEDPKRRTAILPRIAFSTCRGNVRSPKKNLKPLSSFSSIFGRQRRTRYPSRIKPGSGNFHADSATRNELMTASWLESSCENSAHISHVLNPNHVGCGGPPR